MYNAATVTNFSRRSDGRLQLHVSYTGDAGEAPFLDSIFIASDTLDANAIRREAKRKINVLNNNEDVIDIVEANLPYTIDVATPLPTPTSTPAMSYIAASAPFTPGATPQDVFGIRGSASKKITVFRAGITTNQTTAGNNAWALVRRSTANSGGTFAAVAAVPTESTFDAATAAVVQYTANPTAGTLVGRIWSGRAASPGAGTAILGDANIVIPFSERGFGSIVLDGTAESLLFNFNGAALPAGLSVVAWVQWMEG